MPVSQATACETASGAPSMRNATARAAEAVLFDFDGVVTAER